MGNQVSAQACGKSYQSLPRAELETTDHRSLPLCARPTVPHQDVALSIALLLLWSSIGASIGSAASSAIWANRVGHNRYLTC
jgi:hypothetical protein